MKAPLCVSRRVWWLAALLGCGVLLLAGRPAAASEKQLDGQPLRYGYHVALKGAHGRYLVAESDGTLKADRKQVGAWEKFSVLTQTGQLDPGKQVKFGDLITLQSPTHFRFVQGKPDGSAAAGGMHGQPWERFKILDADGFANTNVKCGDTVTLRSSHDRYLVAEPGPGYLALANRNGIGPWERFTLECVRPEIKAAARMEKKFPCAAGQFRDPRNGGECWSCPSGYNRTIHSVTGDQACEKVTPERFTSATGGVPAGSHLSFFDLGTFKHWTCNGAERTVFDINGGKACRWPPTTSHARASQHGKAGCNGDEFHDPRNGGECWTCPAGYERVGAMTPVTHAHACKVEAVDCSTYDPPGTHRYVGVVDEGNLDSLLVDDLSAHCDARLGKGAGLCSGYPKVSRARQDSGTRGCVGGSYDHAR